jgi:hypothetical protein
MEPHTNPSERIGTLLDQPAALLNTAATDTPIADAREAVALDQLAPFDRIVATTLNHQYEFIVASPSTYNVLARGGQLTDFVPACLIGSSRGKAVVPGTIAIGARLELVVGDRWLITTPVATLTVIRAATIRADNPSEL